MARAPLTSFRPVAKRRNRLNDPAFPPHPSVRPRPEPPPNPTSVAVPLLSVMSSAFVPIPMGNFVLRASTRSQRSIATCISQPLPGMALASSAAISHMSLSGAEIAEDSSILVVLAMFFIFLGGLYTDKQRLKPLSHLMLEPQIAGACVRACLVALSLTAWYHPPQTARPTLASRRRTGARSA